MTQLCHCKGDDNFTDDLEDADGEAMKTIKVLECRGVLDGEGSIPPDQAGMGWRGLGAAWRGINASIPCRLLAVTLHTFSHF